MVASGASSRARRRHPGGVVKSLGRRSTADPPCPTQRFFSRGRDFQDRSCRSRNRALRHRSKEPKRWSHLRGSRFELVVAAARRSAIYFQQDPGGGQKSGTFDARTGRLAKFFSSQVSKNLFFRARGAASSAKPAGSLPPRQKDRREIQGGGVTPFHNETRPLA